MRNTPNDSEWRLIDLLFFKARRDIAFGISAGSKRLKRDVLQVGSKRFSRTTRPSPAVGRHSGTGAFYFLKESLLTLVNNPAI